MIEYNCTVSKKNKFIDLLNTTMLQYLSLLNSYFLSKKALKVYFISLIYDHNS